MDRLIIESQLNPLVFERFCAMLISKSENVSIVTTSFNYDRGIDARSIQPTRGSHSLVLCVSLTRELDSKVAADIIKLFNKSKPETVFYCSSRPLTEDAAIKLEAKIRSIVNRDISVRVLGSIQLADISLHYPAVLAHFYHAEIKNIQDLLAANSLQELDYEARGLRLALMAHGSEDAQMLRQKMSTQMILDALALGERTEDSIAARLSKDFALAKGIAPAYVGRLLGELEVEGLAERTATGWQLTANGKMRAESIPTDAAASLLEGRKTVRLAIEELIGKALSDSQYEQLWATLLDGFGEILYTNGLGIIQALSSFLGEDDDAPNQKPLEELLKQLSSKVSSIFSSKELGHEVNTAIRDVFTERSGAAFEWLSGICERYVTLCCLGLESTSSEELRRRIVRSYLVIDTDIALTLLSEGEPDHQNVRQIVASWKQLKGSFLLATPVLEEVAYHASISESEFQSSVSLLGTLRGADLGRFAYNVFVRGFHALSKKKSEAQYWPDYISQFKGTTPYDYTNVRKQLAGILGAGALTDATDEAFESQMQAQVLEISRKRMGSRPGRADDGNGEEKEKQMIDKSRRDGQLLASIASARELQYELGTDKTVILISSSTKIRAVAMMNKARFGPPDPVLSLAAVSYMLSLLPNTRMGADTLRRALFEFGRAAKLNDCDRLALRVIRGSGVHKIGWASRVLLSSKLDAALHAEASKRGVPIREFKRSFAAGDPKTDPATIIATALTQASIKPESEAEMKELRTKLRAAELEIEYLRETK